MSAVALSTDTAWAELHTNIRGFVARRVRQPADVDDIVQQVFLRVHQALPTLRDADKLHAWIYQTTRRVIDVPEQLRVMLLSVRAYDVDALMVDADVVDGRELESVSPHPFRATGLLRVPHRSRL